MGRRSPHASEPHTCAEVKMNLIVKRELNKLASRRYRKRHPERARKSVREYTKRNWEARKVYQCGWQRENRDKVRAYRKKSYWTWRREKTLEENDRYFDKAKYNGLRQVRLEMDEYTCQNCNSKENLHMHHKRYNDNIEIGDLITWCGSCHMKYHMLERKN